MKEGEDFIIRNASFSVEKNVIYSINTEDNVSSKCINLEVEIKEFKYTDLEVLMD